jgi:predicted glycosyltransferase
MKTQLYENHQHQQRNFGISLLKQRVETSHASVVKRLSDWDVASHGARSGNLSQESERRSVRIALYSHDTMGLGHNRRNQLLAQTLANTRLQANILMIAGMREPNALPMPPGVDYLTLPGLYKEANGQYRSRHLNLSLEQLIDLRAKTIRAALKAFKPDVFIADNVPRGALGELNSALKSLQKQKRTHCVLGLRDVLDDPATVSREWGLAKNEDAIRDYYDAVWVYGDPSVYDPVREYHFSPDVAAKMRYVGYLDQSWRLKFLDAGETDPLDTLDLPPGRLVLCLVGGGQDGANLAEAFSQAVLPPQINGIVVTGPFMPPEVQMRLQSRAATNPRLRILNFVKEPTLLLNRADRVIAMGGYNTTCEILSFEKRALIVPRVQPRQEQAIRAERLRDLGLIDLLHPDDLNPSTITEWLALEREGTPPVRERVDLNGLSRLPYLLEELVPLSSSFLYKKVS